MTINHALAYAVMLLVICILVVPVFTGVSGGGQSRYGTQAPEYSRDNPNEAPMYYVQTGMSLLFVCFLLWIMSGYLYKASQPGRPKPVFINELTDSPISSASRNSSPNRASKNLQISKRKNSEPKNSKRKNGPRKINGQTQHGK